MMKLKSELTIEESQHLTDLGVDPKLASKKLCDNFEIINDENAFTPVFTFADVISILPDSYFSEEYHDTMNLCIEHLNNKWFVNYRYYTGGEIAAQDVEKEAPELIDSLYQLLCWHLERKPKTE